MPGQELLGGLIWKTGQVLGNMAVNGALQRILLQFLPPVPDQTSLSDGL